MSIVDFTIEEMVKSLTDEELRELLEFLNKKVGVVVNLDTDHEPGSWP
jgi:hypothetical protein